MRSNLTPNEPDSPSALVSGAKNANFGYGRMMVSCKDGEPVIYSLGCLKLKISCSYDEMIEKEGD